MVLARATVGCCLRLRRGPSVIRTGEEGFRGTPASRFLAQDLLRPVGPLVASQVCLAGGVSCVVVAGVVNVGTARWEGDALQLHCMEGQRASALASSRLTTSSPWDLCFSLFFYIYIIYLSFVSWRTISNLPLWLSAHGRVFVPFEVLKSQRGHELVTRCSTQLHQIFKY